MKLATFDEGRVGRVEGDLIAELDAGSMRELFENGRVPRTTGDVWFGLAARVNTAPRVSKPARREGSSVTLAKSAPFGPLDTL